jgi:tRNA G37 N-methylase Trm5
MMNMMRHLLVPNRKVEVALSLITENNWLAEGQRIFSSDDGLSRLIPLSPSTDAELPKSLSVFEIIICEGKADERVDTDWWNHLTELIGEELVNKYQESWPSSHEFLGDMMVVRIDDNIKSYKSEIARAKLLSHPSIRLILSDGGVMGEFRIRELEPIGGRKDSIIYTEGIPPEIINTKVLIKESGRYISCDPRIAYYSTKLQTERLETLSFAKELRAELGRPLSICDPFCGVGPALSTLIAEEDLVGDLLASDLNSSAIELLFENLQRWDKRDYPVESENLQRYYEDRIVGLEDATKLSQNSQYSGKWDLVLVNLPHRTIEFLPNLVPLLNRTNTSLIRGRVIVAESEIPLVNQKINQILPPIASGKPRPKLKIKRDYSSALRLCSFEAWIAKDGT